MKTRRDRRGGNVSTRRGQQPIPFPIGRYNWSPHVRVNPLHAAGFNLSRPSPTSTVNMTIHIKNLKARPRKGIQYPFLSSLLNLKCLKQLNKPLCVPRSSLLCWLAGQLWTMSCQLALARPTRRNCFSVCGLPCVL